MVDGAVITGMMFAMFMCVTVPVIIIMYIMFKIKPYGFLPFLIGGVISVVIGPVIIGTVLGVLLRYAGVESSVVTSIITAMLLIIALAGILKYLEPGGIYYKQIFAIAAGADAAYAIVYNYISISERLKLISAVKNGGESYYGDMSDKEIKAFKEVLSNMKASDYYITGIIQTLMIVFLFAACYLIMKGIYENKFYLYTSIVAGVYVVKETIFVLLSKYAGNVAGLIFTVIAALVVLYYIKKIFSKDIRVMSLAEKRKKGLVDIY
ncbi:MAG: hypothetical protein K6G26_12500 [Lachnospiraceae bacterium]|nr:hypothetical protein [Lachnospiraceae bacterium]